MKTLVAFGTKYGSTEKVALEITSVLQQKGHKADMLDLRGRKNIELEQYELVVIGSGIEYGSWSKEALCFLDRNSRTLNKKKLAMFACCGDLMFDPIRADEYRRKYLQDVADKFGLHPIDIGLFGGVLDFSKYSFLVKDILSVHNTGERGAGEKDIDLNKLYDLRDWNVIRKWASDLDGVL